RGPDGEVRPRGGAFWLPAGCSRPTESGGRETASVVGVVEPAGLLVGVLARPLEVPQPPLGVLLPGGCAAAGRLLRLRGRLARGGRGACLRLVAGGNRRAVPLLVRHIYLGVGTTGCRSSSAGCRPASSGLVVRPSRSSRPERSPAPCVFAPAYARPG